MHLQSHSIDIPWIIGSLAKLSDSQKKRLFSEWATENRVMPKELSSHDGPWDNAYTPYCVEILDALSPDDPTREIAWMKPGQIGATTAVIENWIGATIDIAPAPMMFITGSEELAKTGIEVKIDRMLASANLEHKIKSPLRKTKKSGNTTSRKDFAGGFLLAYGGQSTSKLKSVSIQNAAIDEVEEIPAFLGKQGDPLKLIRVRQRAFEATRKTLYLSTPILVGGPIHKLFLFGDQRYYYVPCKKCGFMQVLEFRGKRKDGRHYGVHYELDKEFILIEESVEYWCKNCLAGWRNHDKYDFLNAGHWRATQRTQRRHFRSYHLDGLYAPEGNYSWTSMVQDWLECWDPRTLRIIDVEALRVFQNASRGLPYEERGESPKFEVVNQHRRAMYDVNQIPNKIIFKETGSKILLLTAAVDVHIDWLAVEIRGWCAGRQSYSIDWRRLEAPTKNDLTPAWEQLTKILEEEVWVDDNGRKYYIALTLIDASYKTDEVYEFCRSYVEGVYAIMGRDMPPKNARMREFSKYTSKGLTCYNITVTLYKDRVAAWLRKDWDHAGHQPIGYINFPVSYGDDYFRQYEAEEKVAKIHKSTGKRFGFFWKQKPNAPNHAWDCAIYEAAALDMIVYRINMDYLEEDRIDYKAAFDYMKTEKLFYYDAE